MEKVFIHLKSFLKFLLKVFGLRYQFTLRRRGTRTERIGDFTSVDYLLEPIVSRTRGARESIKEETILQFMYSGARL